MTYNLIQAIFHSKFVMFAMNCDLKTTSFPSDGHHKDLLLALHANLWPLHSSPYVLTICICSLCKCIKAVIWFNQELIERLLPPAEV